MVLKSVKQQTVIFIYGIPGTGKSTMASVLSTKLFGASVVSTDIVREIIIDNQISDNNWLNSVSHQAWQHFGIKTEQTVLDGFINHAAAVHRYVGSAVERLLHKHNVIIVEGVHYTKAIHDYYRSSPIHFIPVALHVEKEQHIARLEQKLTIRQQQENVWVQNYAVMTLLNTYYRTIADEQTIIIENEAQLQLAIQNIEEKIKHAEVLR